ncbi:hypothetical protein ADJ79_07850 [Ottowia sp. oral taxon 894]|nr:hypothetical protein ADJ79_07850 [Ottowia sp. oral taxon 894]
MNQWPDISNYGSIQSRNEHNLPLRGQASHYLHDTRIHRSRLPVYLFQQGSLLKTVKGKQGIGFAIQTAFLRTSRLDTN